jgi:TPR repeat protein
MEGLLSITFSSRIGKEEQWHLLGIIFQVAHIQEVEMIEAARIAPAPLLAGGTSQCEQPRKKKIDCNKLCNSMPMTLKLSLNQVEPLTLKPYFELIQDKVSVGKPYILALIRGADSIDNPVALYPCDAIALQENVKAQNLDQLLPIKKATTIFYFFLDSLEAKKFIYLDECSQQHGKKPNLKFFLANNKDGARGKYDLGRCYEKGCGTERDIPKAIVLYTASAGEGHAAAQTRLAELHAKGIGTELNPTFAVELYQRAAKQGYAKAQYAVAKCLMRGMGVPENNAEARRFLKLSAKGGWPAAQYRLANLYLAEYEGHDSIHKILMLYKSAAEQGELRAQLKLGALYADGSLIAKNRLEAERFYSLAAKQGSTQAQDALSHLHSFNPFK